MSSTSPSSSSPAAASASTASPTPVYSSPFSTSSSSIWIGLAGVVFLIFVSICIMKYAGVEFRVFLSLFYRRPSNRNVNTRLQNENFIAASVQPEILRRPEMMMFDVRTGERSLDGPKWEESMPFSATILTDPDSESSNRASLAVQKGNAGKSWGNSAKKREDDTGGSRLQAAVFVVMPSPLHAQSRVSHMASGFSLRDELVIGLIETPWVQEDHRSLMRNAS